MNQLKQEFYSHARNQIRFDYQSGGRSYHCLDGGVGMNPYIGDRQLDPDEDIECGTCDGFGVVLTRIAGLWSYTDTPCPDCQNDPDPGEPQPYPDEDQWPT